MTIVTDFEHVLKYLISILETCNGRPSIDWDCCTPQSPCGIGEGDCDRDSDCSGALKCGNNNCIESENHWHDKADCCEDRSTGNLILYRLIDLQQHIYVI